MLAALYRGVGAAPKNFQGRPRGPVPPRPRVGCQRQVLARARTAMRGIPYGRPFKERHCIRYTPTARTMPQGHDTCKWLLIGRNDRCGTSCLDTYCKVHRQRLRRGSHSPEPCISCGRGTQAQKPVMCDNCGGGRLRKKLVRTEARTRRLHLQLMNELVGRASWARRLPAFTT